MKPPVRPPRLRCGLFPSIYLSHLLVLPATFGLQRFLPPYPYFPALYVVSVRQVRGLPTASSRFHLTMDTLAVQLCASSLPTRTRDFHPLEPAHGGRTRKNRNLDTHCIKIAVLICEKTAKTGGFLAFDLFSIFYSFPTRFSYRLLLFPQTIAATPPALSSRSTFHAG